MSFSIDYIKKFIKLASNQPRNFSYNSSDLTLCVSKNRTPTPSRLRYFDIPC